MTAGSDNVAIGMVTSESFPLASPENQRRSPLGKSGPLIPPHVAQSGDGAQERRLKELKHQPGGVEQMQAGNYGRTGPGDAPLPCLEVLCL